MDWDIVPREGFDYHEVADQIDAVKQFLKRPNLNGESFEDVVRALLRDILELDAGVLVKVFDVGSYEFNEIEPKSGAPMLKPMGQRRMTEIYARDGASFLKEIDKFGFCKGFWQYSYQIPAHPMWFNRDEIVYCTEQPRSMSPYGFSRLQAILIHIKSLHYSTIYNQRLFEESPIPAGALSLEDTDEEEMKILKDYWNNEYKAQPHKIAFLNKKINWQPFVISNRELEFLETQKWYFNLVISMFGLTPTEMGITSDANRAVSLTQAEVVKRKGVRPFIRLLENFINGGIMPEFGFEGIKFQYIYDDPAEKKAKLDNWALELQLGLKNVNEVRAEEGLPPVEGGDLHSFQREALQQEADRNSSGAQSPQRAAAQSGSGGAQSDSKRELGDKANESHADDLKRNEGRNAKRERQTYDRARTELKHPYNDDSRPGRSFKSVEKGVDDGQYYREQPITQPRRASGVMFQPQNKKNGNGLFSQPADSRDVMPSQLGSSHANGENADFRSDDVNCPMCGAATLAISENMNALPEEVRCTNCGYRASMQEMLASKIQEGISNVLHANNETKPLV